MTFERLNIITPILKALDTEGHTTPTPIQRQAIPVILAGKDMVGCAQTGTGKTAAFAVPILQVLYNERSKEAGHRPIKALILTPTRELAAQIDECLSAYGRHTGLRHTVVFGGVSQVPQVNALRAGVDILVATPGRLLDLMNQRHIRLDHVRMFVLDEADRMLDMGFSHDMHKIMARLPIERQTLLFSATMPAEIARLVEDILTPQSRLSDSYCIHGDTIKQAVSVGPERQTSLLIRLLKNTSIELIGIYTDEAWSR